MQTLMDLEAKTRTELSNELVRCMIYFSAKSSYYIIVL